MRRRSLLLAGAAGALLSAGRALAQHPGRIYRVGVLFGGGAEDSQLYLSALSERLSSYGFVEGRNLRFDHRIGHSGYTFDRNPASELLAAKPDALVAVLPVATQALQSVTATVPIIFAWVDEPVASRFVQSYAKPGGNITGVTNRFGELLVKRLELARDLLPGVKRVAVTYFASARYLIHAPPLRRAAAQLGIELIEIDIHTSWDQSVERAVSGGAEVIIPYAVFKAFGYGNHGKMVIRAALERLIPVIFAGAEMVEAGGLMSYGTNIVDDLRRGADLLARVLRGEEPAHIPVDQAARFELAVNLKTARAMGLTIPQSILLRANTVIE